MKKFHGVLASTKADCQNRAVTIFALLVLAVALPLGAIAQITSATIVGTVTDPGGAQVPSASVTARNVDTGLTRTVTSGVDGSYRLEFLPIGNYVVEVTAASGFKKAFRSGIVLNVNETARIDIALEVGTVSEQVTVSSEPPDVNTTTSEIGRTILSQEIDKLPLVERNVYTLLDLTPGVQSNNQGVASASTGTSTFILGYPEQRTLINGGTDGGTGSVNYYLDGGINMTNLRNTGNILPNPDAIQEFKVQTNSYNAEYGRFASGVVNVLTKSGTNKFHGSLFEFTRNTVFNANDWKSTLAKAPYHRNQFGATIGGPVIKDKGFFFFSYAGLRQATSTFLSGARVPTALERAGDFTQSATKPIDPTIAGGATHFSCNGVLDVICPNRIDPVARKIIDTYIPLSNFINPATPTTAATAGWQGYLATPFNFDEYLGKFDYQVTDAHRLSFSYFNTGGTSTTKGGSPTVPWSTQDSKWRQHSVNASDVWVISGNKINQVWLTFSQNFGGRINNPATSLTDLGSQFTIQGTPNLPQITVTGYFTLGQQIAGPVAGTNFYSGRDVFSWIKGKHSLKLGGELSLNKDIQQTLLNNYGVFSFNNSATKNAFADFLVGIPNAVSQDAPVTGYTNTWYTALFAQDDYRVHQRLTLNLGLRWDVQTAPTDPQNRVVNYVPGQKSTVNPIAPLGALFYGDPGVERGGIPTSYTHFSPRVGFAWDIFGDGKTSLRGAFGIFYGSISGNEWNTMTNFQPFSTRLTFTNIDPKGLKATLVNPYAGFPGGNPFPYNGTFTAGGTLFPVAPDFKWPRTYQMNLSVQRQITKDWVVGAAYVGTESRDLPFARDINYPVFTPTASTSNILARRPNTAFGSILLLQSDQSANYHGLQVTTAMRMSHHVSFNAFYVFSKTLSSAELYNSTNQGLAQNYSILSEDKGAGDTDQRHVFSMSMNYQPDYYKGKNKIARGILNGWSISPIIKLRSGLPFTVANGADANLDGVGTDRAQLIGDPHLANPTADMWFNAAAFVRNPAVTGIDIDGNSARNLLYGPGYKVVDLALSRDFTLTERFKLRFRAEGTNIFNLVNYGQPAATAGTANLGQITTAKDMRKLQFGLRLTF